MRKAWLKFGGIAMIIVAVLIAVLPVMTHKPLRFDWDVAAILLIIAAMSIRKARKLNHN
jgi:hypothetical protein